MYYYQIVPADSVSKAVRESGFAGVRGASIVLQMPTIMPRWIRRCTRQEWQRNGSNDAFEWHTDMLGGFAHKTLGVFINADNSPAESLETGIHETHHRHAFMHSLFPGGKPNLSNVDIVENHAREFTEQVVSLMYSIKAYLDVANNPPAITPDSQRPMMQYSRGMSVRELRRFGRMQC